ncbi:hypothetical protein V6N13_040157 [Hibiscus sabdariffa]|uniref:Uncharacterized protein n=1 Tax=Hibiscus sabdariffa TaxID=183260 RepID=A0ABR2STB2_9ROSI
MAVPVIDFSKLNGDDRARTLGQIANACQEWGFFQLVNHGIPVELLERVKKVSSEFYKLEREENFNKSKGMELLDKSVESLENSDWEDVVTLLDDNEWPSNTPGFQETMKEYRFELKRLAEKVMQVMDENLGLPKGYINKAFNDGDGDGENAFFGTKVSHYPPSPHPEKPLPNAIVINTGDQIEVLSNGQYKSAWHRVLSSVDGNRRSIASFYNPSLKATIAPAPQLVEKTKQLGETYPKFVFGDYMSVYVQQKFLPKEPRFQAVRAM